jgi:hypothetical protein
MSNWDHNMINEKEITKTWVAKLLSLEVLAGLVVAIFSAGIIWTSLNANIAVAQTDAKAAHAVASSNSLKLKSVAKDVSDIQTDVALIRQDAERQAELAKDRDIQRQAEQREQRSDIKAILRAVGNGEH